MKHVQNSRFALKSITKIYQQLDLINSQVSPENDGVNQQLDTSRSPFFGLTPRQAAPQRQGRVRPRAARGEQRGARSCEAPRQGRRVWVEKVQGEERGTAAAGQNHGIFMWKTWGKHMMVMWTWANRMVLWIFMRNKR